MNSRTAAQFFFVCVLVFEKNDKVKKLTEFWMECWIEEWRVTFGAIKVILKWNSTLSAIFLKSWFFDYQTPARANQTRLSCRLPCIWSGQQQKIFQLRMYRKREKILGWLGAIVETFKYRIQIWTNVSASEVIGRGSQKEGQLNRCLHGFE